MRSAALIAAVLILAGGATAAPRPASVFLDGADMALGNPKAKVTVAEFASVGCPHCAVWAHTVFPEFKKTQIDTGRVRFVYHEMLTGDGSLAAAGFMLARCAGPAHYFEVVDAVYAQQAQIEQEGRAPLAAIAKAAGLDDAHLDACLSDEAALKALSERTAKDAAAHGVSGTPTFLVQGRKLEGELSLANLRAAITAARR